MSWYWGKVRVFIDEGERPDQGLPPVSPGYPDQGLPGGGWGGPVDPGYGVPGGRPPRPDQGLPWPGRPVDPGYGVEAPPAYPDQGLPGGGSRPPRPDQGLPGGGGRPPRPDQGLPWPDSPVDPGYGVEGPGPAIPKTYDVGDQPEGAPAEGGTWVVAVANNGATWVYVPPQAAVQPPGQPDQGLPPTSPGQPDQGLPEQPPGTPDQGLPEQPPAPDQGLPSEPAPEVDPQK